MRTTLITLSLALTIFSTSCKDDSEKNEMSTDDTNVNNDQKLSNKREYAFNDNTVGEIWENYIQLKTALVDSNNSETKEKAELLASIIREQTEEMKDIAQQISELDDLEKQRTLFSELTQQLEVVFENELSEGIIYKQFCPMAFNNQGAYWFSDNDQIRNPYFGDRMLKCGKVTETIEN